MDVKRSPIDWMLFAALTALWGSAYAFTRMAVNQDELSAGLSPELIIPLRLTGGAILLLIIAKWSGQKWPAFTDWKSWTAMTVMGIVCTATPFFAITHAQQTVDSSLAALYVAAAPLFVSIMAHVVFHDDRMTPSKILGIIVGFLGVAVLFGPEAMSAFGSASVIAQALCLMATFCYALSSIIARFAKDIPPFVFSAGFVTIGAVATWPFLLSVDYASVAPSGSAIVGVIGLIIGPTAAASVLYMFLIQRTSASYVSLTGYLIPIFSAVVGYLAFREVQDWNALLAFGLILSGIWISQRPNRSATPIGEKRPQSP